MRRLGFRLSSGGEAFCSVFWLKTCHETRLVLDANTAGLSHCDQGDSTLCLRFSVRPDLVILTRSKASLPTDPENSAGIREGVVLRALSLTETAKQNVFTLKSYGKQYFLTAVPETRQICEDRTSVSDWERFRVETTEIPDSCAFRDLTLVLAEALSALEDPDRLVGVLLTVPASNLPDLLDFVCNLLDPAVMQAFAGSFVLDHEQPHTEAEQARARLLARLPQAGWIGTGLTALYRWKTTGFHRTSIKADERFDFMGFTGNIEAGSPWTRGARLLHEARISCVPSRKLAILATARDEGIYLLEWLAHHRRIGVEQFFVYTNDLTDGSDEMLRILSEAGELVWVDNTGAAPVNINMQFKAYHHALRVLPEILDYRWCLVVDLDEVVLPTASQDYRLVPLLDARAREGAEAVSMSWRILGPNGSLTWTPGLSAERFVETNEHPLIKTAFRTGLFFGSVAHHPTTPYRRYVPYMTIDGEQHKCGDLEDYDINFAASASVNACVCHYHIRSLEEFVWKFARGENDGAGVLSTKHFRYNDPGIFELFSSHFDLRGAQPALPIADDIRREIRRYMALPGMVEAVRVVEQRFRQQSVDFVEQSVRSIAADNRVPESVQDRWGHLVQAWREQRARESTED